MLDEAIASPLSEEAEIRELNRILQLGTPALMSPNQERYELPLSIYHVLQAAVRHMLAGRAVVILSEEPQLTTQSAANLLGFSRPHLIKLLNSNAIPFQKVGQHRRLKLEDVLAFQKKRDGERRSTLDDLARQEFADGMYEGIGISEDESDI